MQFTWIVQSEGTCLSGLVTDQDLQLAEAEFPGICRLHAERRGRYRTFLELLAAYLGLEERACEMH
jgi:hypothetical protein